MSNYALFFDIDGTLLNHEKQLTPRLVEIIKKLYMTGTVDMYINSGRGVRLLHQIDAVLPYFKGLILANGGYITVDNKLLLYDTIPTPVVDEAVAYLKNKQISFGLLTIEKDMWCFFKESDEASFKWVDKTVYYLDDKSKYNTQVIQFWVIAENEVIDEISKDLPKLNFFKWYMRGADALRFGRSKGDGIKNLLKIKGYDKTKTLAFGDSYNDIPMFKEVEHAICMGSGNADAKAASTKVIGSVNDEGLAVYLEDFYQNVIKNMQNND